MATGQAELSILLKARDEASKALEKAGKAGTRAGQAIEKHWKAASVALAGAGLALEGLARSQAENTKSVERLSARLGINNDELRDMAKDLSNVTFPLEDVLGLMEQGAAVGLESKEALAEYARFWDMVGDATGLAGTELGKAGSALRSVGIAAGDEQEALAAFGFITENTSGSVADFLKFLDKMGPGLRELNLDVDDAASVLAAMEHELGLSAKTARTEFDMAVNSSDGSLEKMLETLGLTEAQVATYRAEVDTSSGVIQRNADIHAASFTPIQKLQAGLKDLAFAHAGAIKSAAGFAPLLIAAGPAARGAQLAFQGLKGASNLLKASFVTTGVAARAAWTAMTGPVGLAIIAITAVVAIGVLLWKNWDTIKEKAAEVWDFVVGAFERVRDVFSDVVGAIERVYKSKLGFLLPGGALIKGLLFLRDNWEAIWGGMRDFVTGIWDGIVAVGKGGINLYIGFFNKLIDMWNALEFKVPGIGIGPLKTPAFTIGTPDIPRIPTLGKGAIVTSPTLALIGESGPEAVVPLTGRGGLPAIVVNVTVNGTVVSTQFEEEVTLAVRDGIRRGGFDGILAPA